MMVDDTYPPTSKDLPDWDLRAEFWVEGIGDNYGTDTTESGTYLYLATDQVRFYEIGAAQSEAHAGGGGYSAGWNRADAEPVPLDRVPPLVLSEILRDVDLFVGVASVGNDPAWSDGGPSGRHVDYWNSYSFGDLTANGQTRKVVLERLIPRLKIAAGCSFSDKFLVVRGDLRTYKIHLGSGNILMEPNDQYLCIVAKRGAADSAAGERFPAVRGGQHALDHPQQGPDARRRQEDQRPGDRQPDQALTRGRPAVTSSPPRSSRRPCGSRRVRPGSRRTTSRRRCGSTARRSGRRRGRR